jgi:hypothetical protein
MSTRIGLPLVLLLILITTAFARGDMSRIHGRACPTSAAAAVLYEEDFSDNFGRSYLGAAKWRNEMVPSAPGRAPELGVRADIEIPEQHMTMVWSLRQNSEKSLPESYKIEIAFDLPADFPGGGIAGVPGVLMKPAAQVRGTPLAGVATKESNGSFLVALSATEPDLSKNVVFLKNFSWFDIAVYYANGHRAIVPMEKGAAGSCVLADAFKKWGK